MKKRKVTKVSVHKVTTLLEQHMNGGVEMMDERAAEGVEVDAGDLASGDDNFRVGIKGDVVAFGRFTREGYGVRGGAALEPSMMIQTVLSSSSCAASWLLLRWLAVVRDYRGWALMAHQSPYVPEIPLIRDTYGGYYPYSVLSHVLMFYCFAEVAELGRRCLVEVAELGRHYWSDHRDMGNIRDMPNLCLYLTAPGVPKTATTGGATSQTTSCGGLSGITPSCGWCLATSESVPPAFPCHGGALPTSNNTNEVPCWLGLPSSPCTPREWGSSCSRTSPHTSLTSGDVKEALQLVGQGPVSPGRPLEAELGHGGVASTIPLFPYLTLLWDIPRSGGSDGGTITALVGGAGRRCPSFGDSPPFFIKKHKER
ncbi:hypothetical protein Sjap_021885 [Stephania japonica]|uniref:Uncharacterized protein n=1 Tax=Stephania japonica TaxID=461633 RepID=A0AAP0HPD5_9MAGN